MKDINVFDDDGPIDARVIEEYEQSLGQRFPVEYKGLLSQHDALSPEECVFKYFYDGQEMEGDINFFGYGNMESPESIKSVQQADHGHRNIVIFGGTADGDYISFDFRSNSADPKIVLMLHDVFDENDKMCVVPLAANFEKFIDSLEVDSDK